MTRDQGLLRIWEPNIQGMRADADVSFVLLVNRGGYGETIENSRPRVSAPKTRWEMWKTALAGRDRKS